jgi:hypothetical protein
MDDNFEQELYDFLNRYYANAGWTKAKNPDALRKLMSASLICIRIKAIVD